MCPLTRIATTAITHISQANGFGADEGTGSIPGVPDVPTDESEEELSWNSTNDEGVDDKGKDGDDGEGKDGEGDEEDKGDDGEEGDGNHDDEYDDGEERNDDDDDQEVERDDENDDEEEGGDDEQEYDEEEYTKETRNEESFDPIPKTPKNNDDEGNGEEDIGLNVGGEEGHVEEEEEDKLYRDVNINQGRGIQATLEVEDSHVTLTLVNPDEDHQGAGQRTSQGTSLQDFTKNRIDLNEQLEAKVLTRSSNSSRTSYAVAADLSEMELKKILIEKMEGNKSIQRSDEQRNLYKALVKAYESDKIILDTRRDDDADKDEEPSAGPDRGSKRRREGKEPESVSALMETVTRRADRSTQGSRSQQVSASESALAEEPIQTTFQMDEPSHPKFDTGAEDQPIVQSSHHPEWFSQQQKPPSPEHD
nr:hypothetical protein [Tanacetum cinerariifolium]